MSQKCSDIEEEPGVILEGACINMRYVVDLTGFRWGVEELLEERAGGAQQVLVNSEHLLLLSNMD
jgi:hypothetical protein